MKYINYEYYRIFYYVAKYKNLTKAASILENSQPNITRSINRLEAELGCKLFVRSNRGVTLTPEGETLFSHIEIAMSHIQAGENELANANTLEEGHISIGCTETALNLFLLDRLQIFHQTYPNIRIHLTNQTSPQAVKDLENGSVDCAIVTSPVSYDRSFHATMLDSFQEILVGGIDLIQNIMKSSATPKNSTKSPELLHLKDLQDFPLIMLGQGTATWEFYNQLFLKEHLTMTSDIEVATADQILPLVSHNMGMGFLPEPIVRELICKEEICEIPLEQPIPERQILLLVDKKRPKSVALQEFIKILKSV
ncbi:MAG: LysR family transcriptional regulator [Eubacteriales bacterium]|nr:LysR family transcriptional regulator [Eubacteriales bacterium]